jgi:hypothetical protein
VVETWEVESRMAVSLVATQCVPASGMVFESPDFRCFC